MNQFLTAGPSPQGPRFRLSACKWCGGDAFFDPTDGGEWRCLQCARPVASLGWTTSDPKRVYALATTVHYHA